MKQILIALALIALFSLAFATEVSDVVVLTDDNFDEEIKKHEFVLLKFHAPWCGHCKALKEPFEKAATLLKGVAVLAELDADAHRKSGERFGIQGFPTLKLFRNGVDFKDFDGGRTAEQIVDWVKKKCGPVAKTIKADEIDAFVKENNGKALVATVEENSDAHKNFLTTISSDKAFEDFTSAVVFGSPSKITLYRAHDSSLDFEGDLKGLKEFLLANAYPLVEEIGAQNFQRFVDAGLPLAVSFFDYTNKEEMDKYIKIVTEAAIKLKGKFSFSYSDGVEYKEQLDSMGGDSSKLPAVAAMNIEKRINYPYTGEFTADAIFAWASGIIDGSVQPFYKSDPIPETQDGDVTVVVGKTFESIVMDETKDVLLEFYAPWCGHCKTLAPKYDSVGRHFKSASNLVIAKVDATTNDTPIQVEGFPTIYWFPAGGKKAPVQYDGPRSEKGFIEFIKKNAVASKAQVDEINAEVPKSKDEL
jgi:protein disulfide-isomerase A1